MSANHFELIVNESENQFEFDINGQTAFVEYVIEGDKIYLTHTEVPQDLQGQGVAGELVKSVLDHVKKQQFTVLPLCSFVAHYINNNPEWHSLLSEGYQL